MGQSYKEGGDIPEAEFEPSFPEGADVEAVMFFIGELKAHHEGLGVRGCAGSSLFLLPSSLLIPLLNSTLIETR